jgi:hypothetical protein
LMILRTGGLWKEDTMIERTLGVCPQCSEVHPLLPKEFWSDDPEAMGCNIVAETKVCNATAAQFAAGFNEVSVILANRRSSDSEFMCSMCGTTSGSNAPCPVEGHGIMCPTY